MAEYVELHCHSHYSFQEGASSIPELVARAQALGYRALALTDHDNLCGAMEFAGACRAAGIRPIIGVELTLQGGAHLTLLAESREGYANLCRLVSAAHVFAERRRPELDPRLLGEHAGGLIALSGCPRGEVPHLLAEGRLQEAREATRRYRARFGAGRFFLELQHTLVRGERERNRRLLRLAREEGLGVVATNNVHYHVRERHRLQDCLVAIAYNRSLEETQRERRPNSEVHLKPPEELEELFHGVPEAIRNTARIAGRCTFDLSTDLGYRYPSYPVPEGYTSLGYLEHLCTEAAVRRYGALTPRVEARLRDELRLIERHELAGFFLLYREIAELAREVQVDLGLVERERPIEEAPPGRGRGSSVALLVGYLLGLSHIDPLAFGLTLERFLPEDALGGVPDIDLDFPRDLREELILRVHRRYGWDRAALTGMLETYRLKGAVRDLGRALGLPAEEVDRLAKRAGRTRAAELGEAMEDLPEFRDRSDAPRWRELVELAAELDGFPRALAQHPGGMVIASEPLVELVPVQRGAIEGRYMLQWDKDAIDDAGFVKIDFLALGALSQLQEALHRIEARHGSRPDLSRIDFADRAVYRMLGEADTIGVFQVESAAQMQTITRLRPESLVELAHEVAAVRPGVGANDGVARYVRRRQGREGVSYDHPLERRALERTLGVILFQDQVNQVAMDVAGFSPAEADRLRRAFTRRSPEVLLEGIWERFREGAAGKGVDEATARRIFEQFNGQYLFPESHAFAFAVTAYQAAWLKHYYPVEFFVALFNQQPMGFYALETLKEDAKRHGVPVWNPDINRSEARCVIEDEGIRLGFRNVSAVGPAHAEAIETAGKAGRFRSIADFLERTQLPREALEQLADAGAFDGMNRDRRAVRWEIGLRYRPRHTQRPLPVEVSEEMAQLEGLTEMEEMEGEYRTLGVFPGGHIMAAIRSKLGPRVATSDHLAGLEDGTPVVVAGLVVRRQRPLGKAVFLTLEDECGHSPVIVWPGVYRRYREALERPLVVVTGVVSRREGTLNVVLRSARAIDSELHAPSSKDWG